MTVIHRATGVETVAVQMVGLTRYRTDSKIQELEPGTWLIRPVQVQRTSLNRQRQRVALGLSPRAGDIGPTEPITQVRLRSDYRPATEFICGQRGGKTHGHGD